MESLASICFCCGAATITLGAFIFGGHSDTDLAPREMDTANPVDPRDMVYAKNLRRRSEVLPLTLVIAGGLLVSASFLLTELQ